MKDEHKAAQQVGEFGNILAKILKKMLRGVKRREISHESLEGFDRYEYLWRLIVFYYNLIIRRSRKTLSPEEGELYEFLKETFQLLERKCLVALIQDTRNGDTRPINMIFEAMGPEALESDIVRTGIKLLMMQGRTVQLGPPPRNYVAAFKKKIKLFTEMFTFLRKILKEKNMIIATSYFDDPAQTVKTKYYRDFPRSRTVGVLMMIGAVNEIEKEISKGNSEHVEGFNSCMREMASKIPFELPIPKFEELNDAELADLFESLSPLAENMERYICNFDIKEDSVPEFSTKGRYVIGGAFTRLNEKVFKKLFSHQ